MKSVTYKPLAPVGCFMLAGFLLNALAEGSGTKASTGLDHAGVAILQAGKTGEVARIAQVVGDNHQEAGDLPQGQRTLESAATASTLEIPDHLVEFLNPSGRNVFLESYVRERLSEKDLPFLHSALLDDKLAGQWSDVVFGICVLEKDRQAFEVVKKIVATPWDWQSSDYKGDAYYVIRTIMLSARNLGWGRFRTERATFTRDFYASRRGNVSR